MIKKFWVIRSRQKLYSGLSFGIAGVISAYTLLTMTVLEKTLSVRPYWWNDGVTQAGKYALLVIPVLEFLAAFLLYRLSLRDTLPRPFKRWAAQNPEQQARQMSFYGENAAITGVLLTAFLTFWQLGLLNSAKGIPGFYPLVVWLLLIAIPLHGGWAAFRIRAMGKPQLPS